MLMTLVVLVVLWLLGLVSSYRSGFIHIPLVLAIAVI